MLRAQWQPNNVTPSAGIGLALVLDTLFTYFADGGAASTHSPGMLFAGVMFAFFAILAQVNVQASFDRVAYVTLDAILLTRGIY